METCFGSSPSHRKLGLICLESIMTIPYVILLLLGRSLTFDLTDKAMIYVYNGANIIMLITQLSFTLLYWLNTSTTSPHSPPISEYIPLQDQTQNLQNPLITGQNRGLERYAGKFWRGSLFDWILYRFMHTFVIVCMWVVIFMSGYHCFVGCAFFVAEVALFVFTTFEWFTLVETSLERDNDFFRRI
ncbi:unnamed protein product [Moneuplotes crassus]|uniref:Uncharacterized protein n=1 Tax=Euplotes crassus TaxID=5936 RepID=A0AAD2D4X3_EUPCR|nr:unnamed protein product [Moneuplotes crassus]